ncbi:Uncharacterised protein [Burkholderia pseudomallei]|nr:Uncharacterised protein [Burkholderia pseudomallei]VBT48674.1 Uncharacterised protein [Burkholderia pseudomallei]
MSRIFYQRCRLPLILRTVGNLCLKGVELCRAGSITRAELLCLLLGALANAKLLDGNGHAVVLEDAVKEPRTIQNGDWNTVLLEKLVLQFSRFSCGDELIRHADDLIVVTLGAGDSGNV